MRICILSCLLCLGLSAATTAQVPKAYDEPVSTFGSNTIIDVVEHAGGIWLATGKGVNVSYDGGLTWELYNDETGLVSENVSSLFSAGARLWTATNHDQFIGDDLYSLSDGVSYTDDEGALWTQVNFGPGGLNIPVVWGGDRTVFDITGYNDDDTGRDWLFFTAFAGGLLASQDNGMSWRRIYHSPSDSIQFNTSGVAPSLRNRQFSCAADTSHGDSLFLWIGTAGGVFQYVFVPPELKLAPKRISAIALCDTCADPAEGYGLVGGDRGISIGTSSGIPFATPVPAEDLPAPFITAITDFRGVILAGTYDTVSGQSTGLARSTDLGASYMTVAPAGMTGADHRIVDFASVRERIYAAAEEGGLFVSADSGQTWTGIAVDSSDVTPANRRNVIYSITALADTLRAATDSGAVALFFDPVGTIDSTRFHVFAEDNNSSTQATKIRYQLHGVDSLGSYDSVSVWTLNRPLTASGTRALGRFSPGADLWLTAPVAADYFDIGFLGDTVFYCSSLGVEYSANASSERFAFEVSDAQQTIDNDTVLAVAVQDSVVWFGSQNRVAVSTDRGKSFDLTRVNLDTLGADIVINYTFSNTLVIDSTGTITVGLAGDFNPALGVQYVDDGPARVWVSGRPTSTGGTGISVGVFRPVLNDVNDTTGYALQWRFVHNQFAWNYAFAGDTTWAATDDGLLMHLGDTNQVWDTIPLETDMGEPLIDEGTSVFAVELIDSLIWAGTDDGLVSLSRSSLLGRSLVQVSDTTTADDEVYAFPVPFRPGRGGTVDFRFVVPQDAYVTLEVYDFAMNLVARPIDNVFYPAGTYPNGMAQGRFWDGRNGRGDVVAVGVYYFKVEYSTGEVRWGKLAVTP